MSADAPTHAGGAFGTSGPVQFCGFLAVGLVCASLAALVVGAADLEFGEVLAVFASRVGLVEAPSQRVDVIVWSIRLPRILLGVCVGAGLAISGATLQGMFRNPLADPSLIGVSSGAAAGAVTGIVARWMLEPVIGWIPEPMFLPIAAFAGGLGATVLVYRIATEDGRTSVATMLLAGIAINAAGGAVIGLMTYAADEAELRSLTLWTLGSLGAADWFQVGVCACALAVAAGCFVQKVDELDALLLGEAEAGDLGVDVQALERRVVLLSAVVVGAGVAFTGLIGFVGLVAPHIVRLWWGPSHRVVVPGAMLLGATLLVGADALARTVVAPAELPIGIVTSLVGAPFFLFLLVRRDSDHYL